MLKDTAKELAKTADRLAVLCEKYMLDAVAEARASGRNDTAGGMSAKQLHRLLQAHVVARLSPRVGLGHPPLVLDGAPEARRFAAAHPLPGLPK